MPTTHKGLDHGKHLSPLHDANHGQRAAMSFEHNPRASALEVIRDQAGLTGTKLVCGAGVCGVCTIRVNGQSVTACMMPATSLANADVQTIEQHDQCRLHPVQKAFLVHDGLQCGFCTPGFINEAITYYEQWQKQHGRGKSVDTRKAETVEGVKAIVDVLTDAQSPAHRIQSHALESQEPSLG